MPQPPSAEPFDLGGKVALAAGGNGAGCCRAYRCVIDGAHTIF